MIQNLIRSKKLQWLVPALGVPFALFAAGPVKEIAEAAVERLGDGTILAFAAAANALTVIP
jgi:hypothetical protein